MKNFEKYKTYKEREAEFQKFCSSHEDCTKCPLDEIRADYCSLLWIELEADEKPLPCPFCGLNVIVHHAMPKEWVSCSCGYSSKIMDEGCSIAEHNRVTRPVMEAEKEGDKE